MQIGQKVTYKSVGKVEHGIIKSISDEEHVFVVYHCDGNWDRYFDYTAARTRVSDLVPGWINMKTYSVVIPIAGHVTVTVEAENEADAKEKALLIDLSKEDQIEWESLESFGSGNLCHCPQPWEIRVIEE